MKKALALVAVGASLVAPSVCAAEMPLLAATLCNWTREAQTYDLRTPDISAGGTIPPRSWKRINRETR